jgi:NAD-dependent DNA ligase
MAKVSELTPLAVVLEVMECGGALRGKSFSITGHLARKREDIVKIIEQAGGQFHEQPKGHTHFLITNRAWNANSTVTEKASSKLLKAQRNGTKIITEAAFYDMIVASDVAASLKETGS